MEETVADNGMVVAKHPLASIAGVKILKAGGNAVDAAVAAAFAVGVAEPFSSGIGGGGSMIVHMEGSEEDVNVDFVTRVPKGASPDMFEVETGEAGAYSWPKVKGDANLIGYKSILVPGTVAGLCAAHERWGELALEQVLGPAIDAAEGGFKVTTWTVVNTVLNMAEFIGFEEWSRIFLRDGRFPPRAACLDPVIPADVIRQPELAETLRKIARLGPDIFYKGEVAHAIVEEMERKGGVMTANDLADYRPRVLRPHRTRYRDCEVLTTRAHGGATVTEMLNILEEFNLTSMGHNTVESIDCIANAMRLAFADRYSSLWDPDSEDVPLERLVSRDHARELARSISDDSDKGRGLRAKSGGPETGHTTHLCAVDKDRNAVSLTNTLCGTFGSGVVIKGTGIVMNDGMFWFNPMPGKLSSIGSGKWPLAAVSPAVLLRENRFFLAVGAPGARRLISGVAESIINVVDYGMTIQGAIAAPRIDHSSDLLLVDTRIPESTTDALAKRGHTVLRIGQEISAFNFGSPTGIEVDDDGGRSKLRGGVDPFKPDNIAAGY